jgi:hypothetical protein
VDSTSAANDPIVYQDGVKLTVGSGIMQINADSAYVTSSAQWIIGNNTSGGLGWDGALAEIAWWDVVLTDEEFLALQKGISPDQIRPEALQHYFPLVRSGEIDKLGAPAAVTGTAVQDHPRVVLPHRRNTGTLTVVSGGQSLTGSGSTQTNITDALAIVQAHALASAAASIQGNPSDIGAIAPGTIHDLAGAASIELNTSGAAEIDQTHVLVVSTSMQVNASTAIAMTQVHVFAGANSTQGNPCGTGAISISGDFIGVQSTQVNQSGTGQVTRTQTLAGAHPVQANLSGSGKISDGMMVEAALTTGIGGSMRVKKPGIPAGTPQWLKTLLEIIIGRRGNAIEPPRFQTLTFSATPTKAECEALYAYTNDVRRSVEHSCETG